MENEQLFPLLFTDKILELIILPTEQCNFRCVYCYETFKLGKMKKETVNAIKVLIKNRVPELEQLKLGWFGGEPLMAKDIILDISSFAFQQTQIYPKLKFSSGMSTNGYLLTLDTAKQLIDVGVTQFQISLDGSPTYHDEVRIQRNGNGTFTRIWKNLLDLKKSTLDFNINLRIHFSKHNLSDLNKLIEIIRDSFSGDKRFRVFFKSIAPLGGKNDESIGWLEEKEAQQIEKKLREQMGTNVSSVFEELSCYICYAGRPTSFVIRSNGSLVKCTVGLDDSINQIGHINKDGTLAIEQETMRKWLQGAVTLNRDLLRCPRSALINAHSSTFIENN